MDSPIRISPPGAAAHARYYGCFSLLKPGYGADHASLPGTRDRSDALDQRSRHHERVVTLERQRWQLPHPPTLIQYKFELVPAQLAPHSSSLVGGIRLTRDSWK